MTFEPTNSSRVAPFSEKGFYLSELRDRTIAIALPAGLLRDGAALEPVLKDLESNRTRVILVSDGAEALESIAGGEPLSAGEPATLPGRVWRRLGHNLRVGVLTDDQQGFGAACCQIVLALGIRKLVWVDAAGGLVRADGERDSFIDAVELRDRIAGVTPVCGSDEMLVHVEAMLSAGVTAVNLCTLSGVADELFTYDGSGTLFTREGYVAVRRLGLDNFDAAADLIERGTAEGYLAPRAPEQIERVLESAFGAFIGGNHLAGLGQQSGLASRDVDSCSRVRLPRVSWPSSSATGFEKSTAAKYPKRSGTNTIRPAAQRLRAYAATSRSTIPEWDRATLQSESVGFAS